MKISPIITALRQRCPMFAGRVAGASEFKPLPEGAKLALPAAYVIPLDDSAEEQRSKTDYWQSITDGFAVIVAINNSQDERGQAANDLVEVSREVLWKALLGWAPEQKYEGIAYEGGNLLRMDRGVLYYQFEFSARFEITEEQTRQWEELQALPDFDGVSGYGDGKWGVDYINPGLGPDVVPPAWRIIEHEFYFPVNTVFISDYSNMLRLADSMNDASRLGSEAIPPQE